jgi:hypothetical protein
VRELPLELYLRTPSVPKLDSEVGRASFFTRFTRSLDHGRMEPRARLRAGFGSFATNYTHPQKRVFLGETRGFSGVLESSPLSASDRRVIALGNLGGDLRATLEGAVAQAGLELTLTREPSHALLSLERGGAVAVLIDTATLGSEQFCKRARGSERLRRVPIVALSRNPSELGFSRVFGWGADDLSPLLDAEPLARRLKAIVAAADTVVTATGQAVVSEPTTQRRTIVGRVLVQAGYEVKFALDKQATEAYCSESETRIAVHSAQMGDPRKLIDAVARAGALPIWIITTEASSVNRLARSLGGLDRVAVTSNAGSPEDLLFLANELVFARGPKRREWRALYGTPVAFRAEGTFRDEYGFSYDVSPTGVYVRSLLPCEADAVEVELRPPRSEERLRLHGKVVRRFAFGSGSVASAPPGFAVKLLGPASALSAWENACRELIHVAGVGSPQSVRPSAAPRVEAQLAVPAQSLRIEAPDPPLQSSDVGALLASTLDDETVPEAGQRPVTVELGAERESMIPGLESEPPAPALPDTAVTRTDPAPALPDTAVTRTDPAPPPEEAEREPLPLPVPIPEVRGAPPPPPTRKGPPGPPPRAFAKTLVGVAAPVPVPPAGGPPPRPASRSGAIALSPPLTSARETPRTPPAAPVAEAPARAEAAALAEPPSPSPPPAVTPPNELDAVLELDSERPPPDVIPDPFSPDPPHVKAVERAPLAFARTMLASDDDEPTVARPPDDDEQTIARAPDDDEQTIARPAAAEPSRPAAAMPSRVNVRESVEPPFEVVPNVPRVPVQFSDAPAARLDEDEPIAGVPRRGSAARAVGWIAAGVVLAAALAVGIMAVRGRPITPAGDEPPVAKAPPATAPKAPAPEATAALPAPSPQDTATPAPAASASAAASEAPAPSASAPEAAPPASASAAPPVPDAPPAPDVTKLPGDRGYLLVRSSASARVFVHGKDVGETNQYLQTSCGIRFVRLGRGFADFIEPGRSVVLKCGQVNELGIEPLP